MFYTLNIHYLVYHYPLLNDKKRLINIVHDATPIALVHVRIGHNVMPTPMTNHCCQLSDIILNAG
jgi:hypothetical protein